MSLSHCRAASVDRWAGLAGAPKVGGVLLFLGLPGLLITYSFSVGSLEMGGWPACNSFIYNNIPNFIFFHLCIKKIGGALFGNGRQDFDPPPLLSLS
jgi:hypothetical protein